jgi:hypothetical protein
LNCVKSNITVKNKNNQLIRIIRSPRLSRG